jgi:ADP-ribose pyrophosphatase
MKVKKLFEHSAGGVVFKEGRFLLIQMRNLEGRDVWTFPKGHIERGETAEQAALRETLEETGTECVIIKKISVSKYGFRRNGVQVEKDVIWFLMRSIKETGKILTPDEINKTGWFTEKESGNVLSYASDVQLLEKSAEEIRNSASRKL